MRTGAIALAGGFAAMLMVAPVTGRAEEGIALPAPTLDQPAAPGREVAVLAGGCFWGIQGVFQRVKGVENALSGYAGGDAKTAHYQAVGSGRTGHAESVEVTFDPAEISYGEILRVFLTSHDPTELNRQGPDVGTQYRSTIFPQSPEQAKVAKAYIDQLDAAGVYAEKVATTIEPGAAFYPAEGYHQNYLTLNPTQPYIVINDLPKLAALERLFPALYRTDPVLVPEETLSN
ncbi:peptide-methionine (S)-S-oxide reductase [Amaricoccus macauensis]|uniref:Peptide methionine sulfoxide reductase MsrA n=1 Tax=Amaricoccus macauensis TaxID=57001 RepID=A0A840SN91_9RHOB|nr:peptide-methionine (S)-S-oxide reductase MsrA [Amaricoccus macauensis]MBB5222065.1 peptide-methionine (S)-S-oxide reductase [Amaricoccus macauensis]